MGSLYNRISVLIGRDVSVLSVSLPREGTGRRQSSPTQEAGSRQAPWSSSWTSGLQDCEIVRFWFLSYSLHLCCTSCPESAILCLVRLVTQSCLTLCNPVDCSPPGSSVHGILQARILEWVAMPSSRGSFQPRSPVLQADSSLSEPPGKPKNTGVGSLSIVQGIFPTQELDQVLLHCRQILSAEWYVTATQSRPVHPATTCDNTDGG